MLIIYLRNLTIFLNEKLKLNIKNELMNFFMKHVTQQIGSLSHRLI